MANVACIITNKMDDIFQRIILENVEATNISENSTITTHPVPSGEMIADHMYTEPASITIKGKFSTIGNLGFIHTLAIGGNLANQQRVSVRDLKEIERYFKKIKEEGILCKITKASTNQQLSSISFNTWENCVLTNIVWVEGINSLDFTFTFTQILTAEYEELAYEKTNDLPNITEPESTGFVETLLDWNSVYEAVLKICSKEKIATDEFLISFFNDYAIQHAAVNAAVNLYQSVAKRLGAEGEWWGDVGLFNAVLGFTIGNVPAALLAVGIYEGINSVVKDLSYEVYQFKYFEEDKKRQQEEEKFADFLSNIYNTIMQLNNKLHVYKLSSDGDQEALLLIDNNYYIFKFVKSNVPTMVEGLKETIYNYDYTLEIKDIQNNIIKTVSNCYTSPTDYLKCNAQNALFRTSAGTYVYLVKSTSERNTVSRGKVISTSDDLLTNYYIFTSIDDPSTLNDQITKIVKEALTR